MIFEEKYVLHSINQPDFIAWFPLLFMCIVIFLTGCDIINFEINLTFLIRPFFFYMSKKLRQKFRELLIYRAIKMK